MAVKKGDLVRVIREKFENSLEAQASDRRLPPYVFDGTGEVVELSGNYAQIKFLVPTPTVWLALEQLEVAQ
jgi:Cyanobacterial and plant NDH-1 subunit O